jgi:cbb3-type cytochrome oxidase maturation protein
MTGARLLHSAAGGTMLEVIMLVEFIVAFLMGLAACCFLFWGILDGAFDNLEEIKQRVLEIENDER